MLPSMSSEDKKCTEDFIQCGVCKQSFNHVSEFINHKINHTSKSLPVECSLCGQSYNQPSFLREHYKKKHHVKFIKGEKTEKINRKRIVEDITDDVINPYSIEKLEIENDKNEPINKTNNVLIHNNDTDKINTVHVVITKSDEQLEDIFDNPSISENESLEDSKPSLQTEVPEYTPNNDCSMIPVENAESVLKTQCEKTPHFEKKIKPKSRRKPLTNKITEEPDFHFIFMNNSIKGKKFAYSKHGFKCLHCDFKTSWRWSLCKHMSEEHSDMMAIHQFIEIKSPDLDSNQTLVRMSDYLADLQKSTKNKKAKRFRGVEAQDKSGDFPCPKCDKAFNRLRYLRKHTEIHKTETKYLCDECGKAFKTKNYLSAHRKIHKTKAFKCTQCSFTSNVNSLIHAHRQLHNEGSVLCDVCGQAYLDNSTLKKHKRVHDMNRPFACTFHGCTWRFNKEVLCQAHVKSHTTVGQFVCNICQYSFRHKHHLQRHLHNLHGIPHIKRKVKNETSLELDPEQNTVNFVIDSEISPDQLESALQQGNLVISSTDVEGNTVNYVTYHPLLDQETICEGDTQTIVIPHNDGNQIIFQQ